MPFSCCLTVQSQLDGFASLLPTITASACTALPSSFPVNSFHLEPQTHHGCYYRSARREMSYFKTRLSRCSCGTRAETNVFSMMSHFATTTTAFLAFYDVASLEHAEAASPRRIEFWLDLAKHTMPSWNIAMVDIMIDLEGQL